MYRGNKYKDAKKSYTEQHRQSRPKGPLLNSLLEIYFRQGPLLENYANIDNGD